MLWGMKNSLLKQAFLHLVTNKIGEIIIQIPFLQYFAATTKYVAK